MSCCSTASAPRACGCALLADGALGRIVGGHVSVLNWRDQGYYDQPGRGTKARDGGGVLITQGIHTLDLLLTLAGLPDKVIAHAGTTPVHRMKAEDLVTGSCATPRAHRYP